MNKAIGIVGLIGITLLACRGLAEYPTLKQAHELFSEANLNNPDIDMYRDPTYNDFQNRLFSHRDEATEMEKMRMKDFLLTTLTSIVVRVSTNTVDDGTATIPIKRDRGNAFFSAMNSIGDLFMTNVTDCLAVAEYIGRVQTVSFPEDRIRRRSTTLFYSPNLKEMEAWKQKREEWLAKEAPIRELQVRVSRANERVRDYRRKLFMICNSCVLANRKIMDDTEFAAFTNRVVELSKPDENESKFHLFNHLDEEKRK